MANSKNEGGGPSQTTALLLNKPELARAVKVSTRTVENWQKRKTIPYLRLSNRLVRFSLPRVLEALSRFEVKEGGARR